MVAAGQRLASVTIIAATPTSGESPFDEGVRFFESDEYDKAIDAFAVAILLDPEHANAWFNRGVSYARMGWFPQAIEDYDKAIRLNPQLGLEGVAVPDDRVSVSVRVPLPAAESPFEQGVRLFKVGEYEEAIDAFTRSIILDPERADAYFNRGILHAKLGRLMEGMEDYDEAVRLNMRLRLPLHRGHVYSVLGRAEMPIRLR